jgi:tetratricopeptide (TPR) repeat protein
MPKRQAAMADHLAFTDHAIRPKPVEVREERKSALRSFFADVPGPREWALGYAIAASTEPEIRPRAFTLLEQASAAAPNDALLLSQLSQFYDRMGQPRKAMPLAERAIALDPEQIAAAINLGGYVAAQGRLRDAIMLWESVLRRNPGSTEARMNLAVARARSGDRAGALTELTRLLDYEPDHPLARKLLSELREK